MVSAQCWRTRRRNAFLKNFYVFRKTYFQIKVNNLGSCHNVVRARILWEKYFVTTACFSCYLPILFTSHTWQNSQLEALCSWKNLWNQNLLDIKLNTRFLFIYISTSYDTKSWTIASNHNFKSVVTGNSHDILKYGILKGES